MVMKEMMLLPAERIMIKIGFLHFTNAPTDEVVKNFSEDIEPPTEWRRSKAVVFSMIRQLLTPMKTNVYSGD